MPGTGKYFTRSGHNFSLFLPWRYVSSLSDAVGSRSRIITFQDKFHGNDDTKANVNLLMRLYYLNFLVPNYNKNTFTKHITILRRSACLLVLQVI
jgi:hypothetical protein